MKLPFVVNDGDSRTRFDFIELSASGTAKRQSTPEHAMLWWQVTRSQPSHRYQWTSDEPRFIAVFSGQLNIYTSDARMLCFARGDMLVLDHKCASMVIAIASGIERCEILTIALDPARFSELTSGRK